MQGISGAKILCTAMLNQKYIVFKEMYIHEEGSTLDELVIKF